MATYYILYSIYNWHDDNVVPTKYTNIGGVSIRSQFSATTYYNGNFDGPVGFNHIRFAGLVHSSQAKNYEGGFPSGDVGTEYLTYQSVNIPDDADIDPNDIEAGPVFDPPGEWKNTPSGVSIRWNDVSVSGEFKANVWNGFKSVANYMGKELGVANVISTIEKSKKLYSTLYQRSMIRTHAPNREGRWT